MSTAKSKKPTTEIYIIQNIEGFIHGVFDNAEEAIKAFRSTYKDDLETLAEFDDLFDSDEPFVDCDNIPMLSVWKLNGGHTTYYETPQEAEEGLLKKRKKK